MKLFTCQACGQMLYFENTVCEQCGRRLGYLPDAAALSALEPEDGHWRALAPPGGAVRFCANAATEACNWLLPADAPGALCRCCASNRTIPDLGVAANLPLWRRLQAAKHRLVYSLLRLDLPLRDRIEDPAGGLAFDFLADDPDPAAPRVMTGHANGVITIALEEADDPERERRRTAMGEPYRTLLGHFRHEVGHYYWDVLLRDGPRLEACRALFGDERRDYAGALAAHYRDGAPADWQQNFVSDYASAHPWEDWAETWAHYLHIVDTLEMAVAFGLRVRPRVSADAALHADIDLDPYRAATMAELIDAWLPLCFAVNSLNRAMGRPDLYPFVLAPAVVAKLAFVHEVVRAG
jgi:hypothetical protein